jgi:hypothetical protein
MRVTATNYGRNQFSAMNEFIHSSPSLVYEHHVTLERLTGWGE